MPIRIIKCGSEEYLKKVRKCPSPIRDDTKFYLAEKEDLLVGSAFASPSAFTGFQPHYFIHYLKAYVERNGVGRALTNSIEEDANRQNLSLIVLKSKNHGFWKKMGYEIDEEKDVCSLAWRNIG